MAMIRILVLLFLLITQSLEIMALKHELEEQSESDRGDKRPRSSLADMVAYQAKNVLFQGMGWYTLLDKITTVFIKSKEAQGASIPLLKSCFEPSFFVELAHNKKGEQEIWLEFLNEEECIIYTPFSLLTLEVITELFTNYEAVKALDLDVTKTYVGLDELLTKYSVDTEDKKAEVIKALRFFKLPLFQGVETYTCEKALQLLEHAKSTDTLYSAVEKENLKTLLEADKLHMLSVKVQGISLVERILQSQLMMMPSKKRRIAFTLARAYEKQKYMLGFNDALDERSWQDLEIIAGSRSNLPSFFASCIDQTVTELGKALLYKRIVYPTHNSTFLKQQQEVLTTLINHRNFNQIDRCLKELGDLERENCMLSFWGADEFNSWLKSTEIDIPRWQNFSKWLSERSLSVEILREGPLVLLVILVSKAGQLKDKIVIELQNFQSYLNLTKNKILDFIKDMFGLGGAAVGEAAPYAGIPLIALGGSTAGYLACYGFQFLSMVNNADTMKDMITLRLALQKKLMLVVQYIAKMKELYTLVKTDALELENKLPFLEALNIGKLQQDAHAARLHGATNIVSQMWAKVSTLSDLDSLLNNLDTDTFQGDPSVRSYTGRIVATYRIMNDCKDKLVQSLGAVGELDMYMSIARLYKKYQARNLKFCLPTYNQSSSPYLAIKDFWNPLVGDNAIVNSLAIGRHLPQNLPQNVVITGPNGGGKSTVMKSIVFAVIMAQTLGICPAQRMEFTPFSKIRSYLNIADDITRRQSLFQAIAQRAVDIQKDISAVPQGEYSLALFDELFDGTEAKAGEALACAFMQRLTTMKHNISLLITHFQQLPHLVTSGPAPLFSNYRVAVDDRQDRLTYPYRLEPGISGQSVAFKVLAERGFDRELLSKAENVLQLLKFNYAFGQLKELMQAQELPEELRRNPDLVRAIKDILERYHP